MIWGLANAYQVLVNTIPEWERVSESERVSVMKESVSEPIGKSPVLSLQAERDSVQSERESILVERKALQS